MGWKRILAKLAVLAFLLVAVAFWYVQGRAYHMAAKVANSSWLKEKEGKGE